MYFPNSLCAQKGKKIEADYRPAQNKSAFERPKILLRRYSRGKPTCASARLHGNVGSEKWFPSHAKKSGRSRVLGFFLQGKIVQVGSFTFRSENQSCCVLQNNSRSNCLFEDKNSSRSGIHGRLLASSDRVEHRESQKYSPFNIAKTGPDCERGKIIPNSKYDSGVHRVQNLYSGKTFVKNPQFQVFKVEENYYSGLKISDSENSRVGSNCWPVHLHVQNHFTRKQLLRNVYRLLASKKSWEQDLIIDPAT